MIFDQQDKIQDGGCKMFGLAVEWDVRTLERDQSGMLSRSEVWDMCCFSVGNPENNKK
jgi:hypothetical protein